MGTEWDVESDVLTWRKASVPRLPLCLLESVGRRPAPEIGRQVT